MCNENVELTAVCHIMPVLIVHVKFVVYRVYIVSNVNNVTFRITGNNFERAEHVYRHTPSWCRLEVVMFLSHRVPIHKQKV